MTRHSDRLGSMVSIHLEPKSISAALLDRLDSGRFVSKIDYKQQVPTVGSRYRVTRRRYSPRGPTPTSSYLILRFETLPAAIRRGLWWSFGSRRHVAATVFRSDGALIYDSRWWCDRAVAPRVPYFRLLLQFQSTVAFVGLDTLDSPPEDRAQDPRSLVILPDLVSCLCHTNTCHLTCVYVYISAVQGGGPLSTKQQPATQG